MMKNNSCDVRAAVDDDEMRDRQTDRARQPAFSADELIAEVTAMHHVRLRAQVTLIERLAGELTRRPNAAEHDDADPLVLEIRQLVQGLTACVDAQLTTEEQVLFPMLRRLEHQTVVTRCHAGMIRSRVMVTEREFARIRGVMARLRDLVQEYASPAAGVCVMCPELLATICELLDDLHEHARKELEVLYPWALARERELAS